jgi:antitoxin (DNA-binding transcriptional repressor) of toxin-antitoxin stability system
MKVKRISITEFNQNISQWIEESNVEPIALTKKGIVVAYIVNRKLWKYLEERL